MPSQPTPTSDKHPTKRIGISGPMKKIANDKARFGGNREKAIQRDGEKCVKCGMTRAEHRAKYGRDISVDHIDGNGSSKPKHLKNSDLSNLQTLCIVCHTRKDNKQNKLTDVQIINIRHIGLALSTYEKGRRYGVDPSYIWELERGIWAKHLLPDGFVPIKRKAGGNYG